MDKVKKTAHALDKIMNAIFTICGFLAVALVVVITVYLVVSGIPAIKEIGVVNFLFGTVWKSTGDNPSYGILPFILTSVFGTFGAMLIGFPLGLLCAVCIAKMSGKRFSGIMRSIVDLMSGIPSVVFGLVGMIYVVPAVREMFNLPDGANLFSAIVVLIIMILPSVISMSETAIRAVPKEYEEASLALGANKTETIFNVTIPAAKSGILASLVMGTGRAIGEATAVMMVAGNVANMPGLFKSVRFLTTAIVSEMAYSSGLQRQALFSIALVLFVFIMIVNLILNLVVKRKKDK
ncbi:MAG: phosphate ABC transporter permease subunit PstC [Oscillospiraceae bacterium]|nr:phosphate ABC transporter permease subunit PstC [Ruminococcus sp.]MCD8345282.1 phosphate ABC transporter permease subunit PstC [Oscillospiraceae bacterium]